MAILIVGEKPSVSRAISSVVGANATKKGYTEGNGYIVSWCVGHLVGLKFPNDYGNGWNQKWSFSQLPMIPDNWLFQIKRTADQPAVDAEELRKKQAQSQEHQQDETSVQKSGKLLPLLNAKAEHHQSRIDSLDEKIANQTDKIDRNKANIEALSAKADKLEDTNRMLKATIGNLPGIGAVIANTNSSCMSYCRHLHISGVTVLRLGGTSRLLSAWNTQYTLTLSMSATNLPTGRCLRHKSTALTR